MAVAGAIRAARAFVELFADDSRFQATMRRVEAKLRATGEMLRRWGGGALLGAAGLTAALAPAVASFVDFDDAMRQAQARAEATAGEMARLRTRALEVARATGFTATQVAKLMVELGTAGFGAREIESVAASVSNLAKASGAELGTAANLLGTVLKQYGMAADQSDRLADLLTVTANKSRVTVESLRYTFQYLGSVGAALDVPLEDLLAMVGVLGDLGITGTEAGTALRRLELLVTTRPAELMELFGVAAATATGKVRPLVEVLADINRAAAGMTQQDRVARLAELFGILGVTAAAGLVRATQSVETLRDRLLEVGGEARRQAREMESGLGGALRLTRAYAVEAALALGEALAPALMTTGVALRGALSLLTDWVNRNRDAVAAAVPLVAALVGVGLALKAAGVVLGGLALALGAALTVVGLLAKAFLFLLAPVGLVAAAVAGFVGALFKLSGAGGEVVRGLADMAETFKATFGGIVAAVKKGDLQLAWEIATAGIQVAWKDMLIGLRAGWDRFKAYMTSFEWVRDVVLGVANAAKRAAQGIVDAVNPGDPLAGQGGMVWRDRLNRMGAAGGEELKAEMDRLEARYNRENKKLTDLRLKLADPANKGNAVLKEAAQAVEENLDLISKEMRDLARRAPAGPAAAAGPQESEGLKALKAEREDLRRELQRLIDLANRPEPAPPADPPRLPVAPRPRELGGAVPVTQRFGDAVRGTFQSGDFRGFFGLGPANTVPRQQLDAIRDVAAKMDRANALLVAIEQKSGVMFYG